MRQTLSRIGGGRLLLTCLFLAAAFLLALSTWNVPLARDAERALYDIRFFWTARQVPQDERIVLVTYDDQTLAELRKRSPLDRGLLARALTAIDALRPRAIGVDILIDQAQPEDPQLLAALMNMHTPTFLAHASHRENGRQIDYWQEQFLNAFIRDAAPARAASVRLEPDGDNVLRAWPRERRGGPLLLADAMAGAPAPGVSAARPIAFRLPESGETPVFMNLPIQFVAANAEAMRPFIEGRYVLIGGNINDLDDFETSLTHQSGRWTKGLEVHATLLAQRLDRSDPKPRPLWAMLLSALAVVIGGALTGVMETRRWVLALTVALQIGVIGALPFLLQAARWDTLGLPAFGWGAGWLLAFVAAGMAARSVGAEQRRFAQAALGKYLPRDVAMQILREPERLALHGEQREIHALFTDLAGFTELSHAITPAQLSRLLNAYLDLMSETVLRHGGTIDKFVGDAVVAFWGAPIAREDDAERAAQAAVAMFAAGEEFRCTAGAGLPPIGCTRVGLHKGEAVVGNFGGEGRIQYTALGDGMNTAARLESANKALKTTILVSSEARQGSALDFYRPMGRIGLSGRATPIEVWEPVPHHPAAERERLCALYARFEAGEPVLGKLEAMAAVAPEDAALGFFVYRLREVGPGGCFVLGSK